MTSPMAEQRTSITDTPEGQTWANWMVHKALPLWSTAGYDQTKRLYHERLTFDATPIMMPHLRLMVQARQIATFCRATLDGVFNASQNALTCLNEVQARYWRSDNQPGWVFALGPDGRPANTTRDLYAHAFILFAYAWAYRLSGDKALLRVVNDTISEIETIFQVSGAGFLDAVPSPDAIRRQNPHMHLLEAYLVLFEITADQFYLDHAQQLITLALEKFMSPHSGILLEFFGPDWAAYQPYGHNAAEPGHLFEWSWLLNEAVRLNPTAPQTKNLSAAAERLFKAGVQHGITHNVVRDGITDNGTLTHASTRIWPQTELIRLLACRNKREKGKTLSQTEQSLFRNITQTFFTSYAPASLQGGWVDRRNTEGDPIMDHMPASSLYHIYGAAREFFKSNTQENFTREKEK